MKKNLKLLLTFSVLLLFFSCSNEDKKKEELKKHIEENESKLRSSNNIDNILADSLVKQYYAFSKTYPEDKMSPDYLFKAGEVSSSLNESTQAIAYLKALCEKYPNDPKAKHALFLQGFIYDSQLKDMTNAKAIYEQVVAKYPGDKLAEDAKAMINNLGKSDEQLIREFEEKNK